MKNKILTLFCLLLGTTLSAQLVNNGGTITIQNGAKLFVESDIENNTSGTISIQGDGEIEVQGDFDNTDGTLTAGIGTTLRFTGSGTSNVTSGTHTIGNVVVAKTSGDVLLIDDMTIGSDVSFETASKLDVDDNTLTLDADATITAAASDRYIVADGGVGGAVTKEKTDATDFKFEIGDATSYAPVEVTGMAGTTSASSTITASTEGMKAPNAPVEATDFINRHWDVSAANITDFEATLEGVYADADIESGADEAKLSGAGHDGTEWDYTGSTGDAGTNTVSVEVDYDDVEFTATNKFGKVDVTAFLQGAYTSGATMTSALTSLPSFPLTSPYTEDAITVASVPADVVDWVLVQLRDATTPATILSSHSAFLKTDGSVVSSDGNTLILKDAPASAIVSLKHRNHLAVRTATALDLTASPAAEHDFSTSMSQAYNNASVANDPMVDVSGKFCLYAGDANGDGYVRYTNGFIPPATFIDSDRQEIFTVLGGVSTAQLNEYSNSDVNIDGYVRYTNGFIPPATFIDSDAQEIFNILGNVSSAQLQSNL